MTKVIPHKFYFELENPDIFIKFWLKQISDTTATAKAIDVYKGRSVSEVINASSILNAEILFISAGLGLVKGNEYIPSYDLTVSDGDYSLKGALKRWNISELEWWGKLLNQCKSNETFQYVNGPIFVALPSNYLKMILPFLKYLDDDISSKLHLFIHPASYALLPKELKNCYIPYNYSIDYSEFSGTKVDYCQRCLNHFVKFIYQPGQDICVSIQKVNEFICGLPSLQPQVRRRTMDDQQVTLLLLEGWEVCEGKSGRLLRFLRDSKGVACEQGRFKILWSTIKTAKNSEH